MVILINEPYGFLMLVLYELKTEIQITLQLRFEN